jgi:dihydroxyacetone kinase-like protein
MQRQKESGVMQAVEWVIRVMAENAVENEDYFSDLDAVVGDGDFGHSLARGFEAVLETLDESNEQSPGALLRKIGMVLMAKVGGTSGPIWGTAFMRAGSVAGEKNELTGADVIAMLHAGIDGICERGGASIGDKTLLDALIPATTTLGARLSRGEEWDRALAATAIAARTAADATRDLIARRGRASYTGERSLGTLDAGAVAVASMFERLAERWPLEGK